MSSQKLRPRLDHLLEAYVSELPEWPTSPEALDQVLQAPVDDPYTEDELEEKATRVLAMASRRETICSTPVVEFGDTLPLFGAPLTRKREPPEPPSPISRDLLVDIVRRAFLAVFDGDSTDKVIANPDKNALFIEQCWKLRAQASQFDLNRTLLYARKNNLLGPLPGVKRYRVPRVYMDQYLFASELALRLIQDEEYYKRQGNISLDDILCDPDRAQRFEAIARRLAPGFAPLDYRWAALTIRKALQRSTPTQGLHWPKFENLGRTKSVVPSRVPTESGFYWLQCDAGDIFISHAENLRQQIDTLFQIPDAGTSVIPGWVGNRDYHNMEIAIARYPGVSPSKREPFKTGMVATMKPLCNAFFTAGAIG